MVSHLSQYKVIKMLLILFPTLYIISPLLIHLITRSLCLLIPCSYYAHLTNPVPSGNPLLSFLYLNLFLFCLGFCLLDSTCEWNCMTFVLIWLISLSIIPSRSVRVVAHDKVPFFLWLVIFHFVHVCVFVSHFLYPFIHRWTIRLQIL